MNHIISITFTLIFQLQSITPAETIQNQYERNAIPVNVEEIIRQFKDNLIERGLLNDPILNDPSALHGTLDKLFETHQPNDLGIDEFIPQSPFTEAQKILARKGQSQSIDEILFLYAQLLSEKYVEFRIHLEEKRLVNFQNRDLPINSFEAVLFEEIGKQKLATIEDTNVIITADSYTDYEFVIFMTKKLREAGIRKITFSR